MNVQLLTKIIPFILRVQIQRCNQAKWKLQLKHQLSDNLVITLLLYQGCREKPQNLVPPAMASTAIHTLTKSKTQANRDTVANPWPQPSSAEAM